MLNEVIAAEKEVQRCIEQEQQRLKAWLEQVRGECAAAVSSGEREDGPRRAQELAKARQDAEEAARQVTAEAAARAERLERLTDAALTGIVLQRLPGILME